MNVNKTRLCAAPVVRVLIGSMVASIPVCVPLDMKKTVVIPAQWISLVLVYIKIHLYVTVVITKLTPVRGAQWRIQGGIQGCKGTPLF